MQTLRGKHLAEFIDAYNAEFATDINVGHKIRNLTVFDFRSFLNIGMLLSESERAKNLRQLMLDIVIDLINRKTGGGTKYINQRDKDFLFSSLQEDNYRRQFTDALKECVVTDRYKYAHFTDLIYVSIFKEKAKEYKKILDLKATDKVRDTFYSEILDIVAAYESGLAEALRQECEKTGRPLTIDEAEAPLCFRLNRRRAPSVGFIYASNAVDNCAIHRLALADVGLQVVVIAHKRIVQCVKAAQIADFRAVGAN